MRVFQTRLFQKFVRRADLDNHRLLDAVARADRGLIDADLGGGVIKQRIARHGGGRSGGFRTIILFRAAARAVFVYGFAKNERDTIRDDELAGFRRLAGAMLVWNESEIQAALSSGALTEVSNDQDLPLPDPGDRA